MKGAVISGEKGINEKILDLLKNALDKGYFDAILIPSIVPAGDSYAYLLIKDKSLLEGASPLPPIMPVQGGKVLDKLTRLGKGEHKIAAVMRPCEIRAAIELFKLKQTNLENITFISTDCPGAIPLSDHLKNQAKSEDDFKNALDTWESDAVREVCKICHRFSMIGADFHIGLLGTKTGNISLIPNSEKGENLLDSLGVTYEDDVSGWEEKVKEKEKERQETRENVQKEFMLKTGGHDNLLETFSTCITCHNCMRVCPICYCRQCYFDSEALSLPPENYLTRAERKGSIKFPPDTLLFHLGRMSHMVFSCVSCGACEDACPVSLPVSQVFGLVGDRVQKVFNYVPGASIEDPLPILVYEEEELKEFEKQYIETYSKQEK